MRSEIKYFAFDDTEFDSEDECKKYEENIHTQFNGARFFNCDRDLIDVTDVDELLNQIEYSAYYILILDKALCKPLFTWLHEMISFENPRCEYKNGDILKYEEDTGKWMNFTSYIHELNEEYNSIKFIL